MIKCIVSFNLINNLKITTETKKNNSNVKANLIEAKYNFLLQGQCL